ncbi:dephospho-CoA kinase [Maribacter aestuarii]|uniref:dephospho-CoA kinase n=1 Tax=Maribacter aestuarii TaxID=1130723 RepID=UPI00248B4B51|nr:dephospho-CoA kinase [Maribacter aestuarii]
MMIVGLTGGIGSGKTKVGSFFTELGVPVYNSDMWAKKLMESSKKLRKGIRDLFGEEAYLGDKLNRPYIAQSVFGDKTMLNKLNELVHPAVRKHFLKWVDKQDAPYVVQETALLFENKAMDFYDKTILVTAPVEVRIKRVMDRDGADRKAIIARMDNQLEDSKKIELADFVIENINLEETRVKVGELNSAILEYC